MPDFPASGIIINCGGPGDIGAADGQTVSRGSIPISNTSRPSLFRFERWGVTSYSLPVPAGTYDIHLGFAETYSEIATAGKRVFSVTVNGGTPQQIDPFAAGGGRNHAAFLHFLGVDASAGEISISFFPIAGDPCINSIEIVLPGTLRTLEDSKPEPKPEPEPKPDPKPEPQPGGFEPPPHARAAGFTRLLFSEDFLDSSRLSRDTGLRAGQTFCMMGPGNPVWGASVLPANAVRFDNGEVVLVPNNINNQGDIISSASATNGFFLNGNKWCVEIRWKHPRRSAYKGFPAFWSMDRRHWYTNRGGPINSEFLEPDFYEFIGGRHIGALHYWRAIPRGRPQPMEMISGGPLPDVTQFFTAGAMSVPGEYSWYVNNRKMGGVRPSWLDRMMSDYSGPLIIGSGPEFPLVIDWVRVWGPAS